MGDDRAGRAAGTLRQALTPADLAPGGPGLHIVRRRVALLGTMALIVVALALLLPHAEAWWLAMHVIVAAGLALPAELAAWGIGAAIAATISGAWLASGRFDGMLPPTSPPPWITPPDPCPRRSMD